MKQNSVREEKVNQGRATNQRTTRELEPIFLGSQDGKGPLTASIEYFRECRDIF